MPQISLPCTPAATLYAAWLAAIMRSLSAAMLRICPSATLSANHAHPPRGCAVAQNISFTACEASIAPPPAFVASSPPPAAVPSCPVCAPASKYAQPWFSIGVAFVVAFGVLLVCVLVAGAYLAGRSSSLGHRGTGFTEEALGEKPHPPTVGRRASALVGIGPKYPGAKIGETAVMQSSHGGEEAFSTPTAAAQPAELPAA